MNDPEVLPAIVAFVDHAWTTPEGTATSVTLDWALGRELLRTSTSKLKSEVTDA